jgi:hypothetical protein
MAPTSGRASAASGIALGPVIEAQHDDASRVGHELARIGPPLEGLGHPSQVGLRAVVEPGGQMIARLRRLLGGRDPVGVEAERPRFFA